MNRLYCEECQFTFENVNAFKSHICSRIANNVSQGNGCYEFSIPGREAEHLNSEERIRELELSKSRILSTTTWTGDDVFGNLNDISFESPENIVAIIKEFDFSNKCFDEHIHNSELEPPSLPLETDKGSNQTPENCRSLTSDDYFRDSDDALVEKVLSYNFPSEFLKCTIIQESGAKTKSIASGESVEDIFPILEGMHLSNDQSEKYNSVCYLSGQAVGMSESYTKKQIEPLSEFFYNSFSHQNTDNYNTIQDGNFKLRNNLYGSNPSDATLDPKPSRNKCNFSEISPATDSKISENSNYYFGTNYSYLTSNNSSLVGTEIINFFGDEKQCIVEMPSFQSKDKEIFNFEKYSQVSYDEANLSERKQFPVEDISKMIENPENWLKTGFIAEKNLYRDRFNNSAKVPEGISFKKRKLLHKHLNCFTCKECEKIFYSRSNFDKHKRLHTGIKPFKCEECHRTFSRKDYLTTHKRVHSGEQPFECEECHRTFSLKGNLINHKRIHTGEKPFKCEECHRTFSPKDHLTTHKRVHSGEQPFECEECHRTFIRKDNLTAHKRVHSGEQPFECEECHRTFIRKDYLTTHKRVHSGEQPFECEECHRTFSQKGNLINHKRIHTGEKPFKCEECHRTFSLKSYLIKHKRIHTGEKPFKCEKCHRTFSRKGHLTTHKRIHTGEKSFERVSLCSEI
ncbi:zinc finger protein 98 [Trichonephila inaurata madagascariensis]|uniref:Zinc finger protein 98 n=1 Tax=Trichonephila inaurata madagascariensis TaxID=2747483 RepID=A0A8X7CFU5_9ARAC|nr:zinc finger protein 98 [Trichonephila inaurata madagascariensis]